MKPFVLPSIPPRAGPAWLALCAALDNLAARGRRPPCAADPAAWIGDEDDARAEAARACHWCPIVEPCARYASAANERALVWGGTDRSITTDH